LSLDLPIPDWRWIQDSAARTLTEKDARQVQADQDQSLVWDLDALEFVVLTPSDVIAIDDA